MQPLFYLDISALLLTGFISSALLLLSVGAGIRTATNRCFAVFILSILGWVVTSMFLRLSFIAETGNVELMLQLDATFFAFSSPLLFSFAAHYKQVENKYFDVIVIIGIVLLLAMAVPMFSGKIVSDPMLAESGATIASVNPLAWVWAIVPVSFFVGSFLIFRRNRNNVGDIYIAASPLLLLAALILGGLTSVPFPFLSLGGVIGVALLGHGVAQRQVFNPLRKLTHELEEQVRERTQELEQSYSKVGQEIDVRTAELRQEIEERRRTETELRESEQKFRTFSEQSPNMIFINKGGKVVYANNRCEELISYTRREFLSDDFDFRSIIAPDSMPLVERNFARHMSGEEIEPYEYGLVTKEGKRIDAIIHTRLIDYAGERAILGIVTDIRAQKRTERLLKTLNLAALDLERSLDAGELMPIAYRHLARIGYFTKVYWADEKELVFSETTSRNKAMLSIGLFPELEKLTRDREAILLHQDDPLYRIVGDGTFPEENSYNTAVIMPLFAENTGRGILAVLGDDIRENELPPLSVFANQLAASFSRSQLMDELSTSISRLKDTQEELAHAQRIEAVGRLSGGIAHDFNNILTAIHGCAELISVELSAGNDSDLLRYVEEIKRAVRQASGLTQQLLAFSRKQVIERRNIELNSVIRDFESLLRRVIGEDISFTLKLGDNLGTVSLDERQFEQVLMNLTVNARDAMPHGGTITVRTFKRAVSAAEAEERDFEPGSYCVLSFTDTGIGMDSETRRRVFEPFFTTKEFGRGTGLGMSTVYGIIRQCDGYIMVESEPDCGTTYLIYLPETHGMLIEAKKIGEAQEPELKGEERVLVVEDDTTVQVMMRRTLEISGYSVLVAGDASKAMDICRRNENKIDVMLTDVVMPGGMNGFELADWLNDNYPEIKVIFMSGYADEASAVERATRKNRGFLKKPFSAKALRQTLREACDG